MTFQLSPEDGLPYEIINEEHTGTTPWVLACDHASNRIPKNFSLGIDEIHLESHIAYDPGAAEVTRLVANKMKAPAILHRFSRLVLDPNRKNGDPEMMPEIACDGTHLPANKGISEEEKYARIRHLFSPYQRKLADTVARVRFQNKTPHLVTIHSYTPELKGTPRPWHAGILWKHDKRLASHFLKAMEIHEDLHIGDNQPYSLYEIGTSTIENHALELGAPCMIIEIRQDMVKTQEQQEQWAERIVNALTPFTLKDHT